MRLEQLRYIVEIADTGSFTTASEHLFIAQPSISQSVAALEKELNLTIFKRSRLGAVPTEIGRQVIDHARVALNQINEIDKLSSTNFYDIRDTITISSIPTLCSILLPKAICNFKKMFPNVQIKIEESGSKKIRHDVHNGSSEFGLVSRHNYLTYDESEKFRVLLTGKIVAYVGKGSELAKLRTTTYEELIKYPIVLFGDSYSLSEYILSRLKEFGTPNIMSSSQSAESIMNLVVATGSVGFGPDVSLVTNSAVLNGDVIPLYIDDDEVTQFGILTNPGRHLSVAAEGLIKQIIEQAELFDHTHLKMM